MAQALAFGTYIPGTSPVHALNAQVKVILACVFSIAWRNPRKQRDGSAAAAFFAAFFLHRAPNGDGKIVLKTGNTGPCILL